MKTQGIEKAFNSFMEESFIQGAISSTKASWAGSEYCVELYPDGTFRVQWGGNIGNLYESQGIVLGIPALNDEDWDGTNESEPFYGNAEDLMREKFSDYLTELRHDRA